MSLRIVIDHATASLMSHQDSAVYCAGPQRDLRCCRNVNGPFMSDSREMKATDVTRLSTTPRSRIMRWQRVLGILLLLGILTLCVPGSRTYVLRLAGRAIVVDQPPVGSADMIVVAIDAGGAGTLEAADLVHRGVSNRVAVFDDPPSPVDREFLRRGLPFEDRAAVSTRQLQS